MHFSILLFPFVLLSQRSLASIVRCIDPHLAGVGSPQGNPGRRNAAAEILSTRGVGHRRDRDMYTKIMWEVGTRPHAQSNTAELLIGDTFVTLRPGYQCGWRWIHGIWGWFDIFTDPGLSGECHELVRGRLADGVILCFARPLHRYSVLQVGLVDFALRAV